MRIVEVFVRPAANLWTVSGLVFACGYRSGPASALDAF
jgi:hypothetical protein